MTRKNKNKLNKLELGIILILSISLFLCLKQTYYKKVVGQIIYCQGNSLMVQQKGEWQKYDKIISIKPLK